MRRVLVTGATGFLGRHCLAALAARGWNDIHAVSRAAGTVSGVRWHAADLLQPGTAADLMRRVRPTHVLHLAWCTKPGEYRTSPANLRWVAASLALLQEFAHAGGTRFVAAGSCAEYSWKHGACNESTTPLQPDSPYGTAKSALQQLVSRFGPSLKLSTAWGRVFFPYGPYENARRLVAYVIRSLLAGTPALCTNGEQIRDYVYAGDAAEAFVSLLESDLGGAFNIASGEPIALKTIVGEIGAQLRRPDLIQLGAREAPPGEPALLTADIARLQVELGWRPRVGLAEGIADSIAHWAGTAPREGTSAKHSG